MHIVDALLYIVQIYTTKYVFFKSTGITGPKNTFENWEIVTVDKTFWQNEACNADAMGHTLGAKHIMNQSATDHRTLLAALGSTLKHSSSSWMYSTT